MMKTHVYEVVKKIILEVIPDLDPDTIDINKNLKELGANSIDRMEVVTLSMEELGVKIPLLYFAKVSNIEDLVGVLSQNHALMTRESENVKTTCA